MCGKFCAIMNCFLGYFIAVNGIMILIKGGLSVKMLQNDMIAPGNGWASTDFEASSRSHWRQQVQRGEKMSPY